MFIAITLHSVSGCYRLQTCFNCCRSTTMASWQYVTVVAALLVAGASAQETTVAVTTLANGNNSDFVYVPTALVDGDLNAVSVRRNADSLGHLCRRCLQVGTTTCTCADWCRQHNVFEDSYKLACTDWPRRVPVSVYLGSLHSQVTSHSSACFWHPVCLQW